MDSHSAVRGRIAEHDALIALAQRGSGGGGGGGGFASVAVPAQLTPLPVAGVNDGTEAWVTIQKSRWKLETSTLTPDGVTVVASNAAGRLWVRDLSYVDPSWQESTQMFIDPVAGSDTANTGLLIGSPLLTWGEYARRVGMASIGAVFRQPHLVTFVNNSQPNRSDPVYPRNYVLRDAGIFSMNSIPIVVPLTGTGGTLTGVTPRVDATNTFWEYTDAGFAGANDWAPLTNLQVHDTTTDSIAWVLINAGARTAIVSEPMARMVPQSAAGFNTPVASAPGDTYQVLQPLSIFLAGWDTPAPTVESSPTGIDGFSTAIDLIFMDPDAGAGEDAAIVIHANQIIFTQCRWDGSFIRMEARADTLSEFSVLNCDFIGVRAGGFLSISGNAFIQSGICRSPVLFSEQTLDAADTATSPIPAMFGNFILLTNKLVSKPTGYPHIGDVGMAAGSSFQSDGGRILFRSALWGASTEPSQIMKLGENTSFEYIAGIVATWTVTHGGGDIGFNGVSAAQAYNTGAGNYDASAAATFANLVAAGTEGLHRPDLNSHFTQR